MPWGTCSARACRISLSVANDRVLSNCSKTDADPSDADRVGFVIGSLNDGVDCSSRRTARASATLGKAAKSRS